ncbi:hypothetical protein HELRODRAFT_162630 [Helobdella robusta]|uniref:Uncharacterized protein n=1 Tax=Helobdella robusta TaxID=6412 RepID=T1ESY0_HELRO|nr:hypothetical protein HELRODRAFT_162630 [Helobdella robusta]ESN99135.1 hypothetical protein HELRODRAFT_162630 [Helobdella robusta]
MPDYVACCPVSNDIHIPQATNFYSCHLECICFQEKICDLYLRLHEPGSEELLTIFGSIILNFIDDIKNVMIEKNHLEQLYERTKDEHSLQIKRMEDEIDSHVKTLEDRVRLEQEKKFKLQEKEWKAKHVDDVASLRNEIRKLKESAVFTQATKEAIEKYELELQESKLKNEELTKTIEELTLDLTSTKSELSSVKKKLEEKECEVARQKKISHEDSIEIDNLISQIDLLQSANKTLHEKTDDLCEALRICRSYYRTQEAGAAALRAADFKNSKYAALAESKIFQPICIETFGPTDAQTQSFLNELCSRIVEVSGDPLDKNYVKQSFSILLQKYNSFCILDGALKYLCEAFNID